MDKAYYREIDIIKGVAILLVILGHSFCSYPFDLGRQCPEKLIEFVRSFQMPLFFMASGFLFSWRGSFSDFARNKVKRLLLPYLAFGFATLVLRICFGSVTHSGKIDIVSGLIKVATGGYYWFLYALFLIMLLMRFVKKPAGWAVIALSSIIVCMFTTIQEVPIFTLGRSIYYSFFFVCGIAIKEFYSCILLKINNIKLLWGGY